MTTTKKLYKQSETVEIKRSSINFAPYNPKNHSKELIDVIKKNIKRVAFLGGIVWNERTTNLIDGHKRVMSLDVIHKYKGTPETDYILKVEKINLDEKTEKEQNIFQTKSRTDFDRDLLSELLPDIDYKNAGLDDVDLSIYSINIPTDEIFEFNPQEETIKETEESLKEITKTEPSKTYEERKEKVKALKEKFKEEAEYDGDPFFTVSFSDYNNKVHFMEMFGFDEESKYIKGEELLNKIDELS